MDIQLPKWLVAELHKHTDKSLQQLVRKILEESVNTEEGKVILGRIKDKGRGI